MAFLAMSSSFFSFSLSSSSSSPPLCSIPDGSFSWSGFTSSVALPDPSSRYFAIWSSSFWSSPKSIGFRASVLRDVPVCSSILRHCFVSSSAIFSCGNVSGLSVHSHKSGSTSIRLLTHQRILSAEDFSAWPQRLVAYVLSVVRTRQTLKSTTIPYFLFTISVSTRIICW